MVSNNNRHIFASDLQSGHDCVVLIGLAYLAGGSMMILLMSIAPMGVAGMARDTCTCFSFYDVSVHYVVSENS